METVNIHEAKTHLSKLLTRVERGERIVIARAGKPIAELGPVRRSDIVFGSMDGTVTIDWELAFGEEAEAEVAAMFDEDIWPVDRP